MQKRGKVKNQPVVHNQLYNEIYSFVRRRVSHDESVADLVQGIFLKLQENQDKIKDEDLMVPWLYRVARNHIIDFYRKKKEPPPAFDVTLEEPAPEDDVFQEVSSWLGLFIKAMSESDQEILKRIEIEGQTQKEAAKALGIKGDAAKARHQRAKKRLKENLEKCCKYSFDANGKVIDYEVKSEGACCEE